jgi:hypothetical protein
MYPCHEKAPFADRDGSWAKAHVTVARVTFDYARRKEEFADLRVELLATVMSPKNLHKFEDWKL